ncbi:MAG: hypothetical protein NC095_11550 [Muribaculum sp.]|nr:hypothetical protein [Muribaculum sp.]
MKNLLLIFLFIALAFMSLAKINVPRGALLEWKCNKSESSISDIIHPDKNGMKPVYCLPSDDDFRERINNYKTIVDPNEDTLFLFLEHSYFEKSGYFAYGWTSSGDTLVTGTLQVLLNQRDDFSHYPIMKYLSRWDADTIGWYYSPLGIMDDGEPWTAPNYTSTYIYRIIWGNESIRVQSAEVDFWNFSPERIELIFSPESQLYNLLEEPIENPLLKSVQILE